MTTISSETTNSSESSPIAKLGIRCRQIIATIRSNLNRIILSIVVLLIIDVCLRYFVIFDDKYLIDDYLIVMERNRITNDTLDPDFPYDIVDSDTDERENKTNNNSSDYYCLSSSGGRRPRREILLDLWTKSSNPRRSRSLFPKCSVFFRAIEEQNRGGGGWTDVNETQRLLRKAVNWRVPEPHDDQSVLEMFDNDDSCQEFRRRFQFADEPSSQEESEFPLAYVFVPSRNAAQTVRLFRMIYQPQNAYCLTYDTKNRPAMNEVIRRLGNCFPENVLVNPRPEPIHYSTYSLLHSVMTCMDLLRRQKQKWRYVQIVSCNDFPLKTNREMVRILRVLNGSQDSELTENRSPQFLAYKHGPEDEIMSLRPTVLRSIPPGGLTFYKGSFATTMSREFVEFLFENPLSRRFYAYLNGSQFPDEIYWSTLVHNIQLKQPGGFPGQCLSFFEAADRRKPHISRYQVWAWDKRAKERCRGQILRSSCVFGIRDLPSLIQSSERMELFAHKVYEQVQPALLYCLEEWYWKRECTTSSAGDDDDGGLNMDFYKNLPSVKYHNLPEKEKEKFVCVQ